MANPLRISAGLMAAVAWLATTGCGSNQGSGTNATADEGTGEIVATVTTVPSNGICLVLQFTNGVATTYTALTAGNSSSAVVINNLPVGSITITPAAYNVVSTSCNSTGVTASTVPTYTGASVTVSVMPGMVTQVQLGLRPNTAPTTSVDFAPTAVAIAAGTVTTYALLADGTIRSWGWGVDGELGNNSTTAAAATPVPVTMGSTFVSASALASVGDQVNHMCAIKASDNTAWCWGGNWSGQLGTGNTTNSLVPVAVTGGLTYSALTIAATTTWAINRATKMLYGWGATFGNGAATTTSSPIAMGTTALEQISGNAQTILARAGSTIWGAGANNNGQLGTGDTNNAYYMTPTYFADGLWPVAVSAGYTWTCAIVSPNNIVQCSGIDQIGQLGDGTQNSTAMPVTALGLNGVTKIATGYNHSCAIMADRTVRCWGANTNGQLGDGTTQYSTVPVQVQNINDALSVVAAHSYTCVLRSDATVWCWGSNSNGQLGNGTTVDKFLPTKVLLN